MLVQDFVLVDLQYTCFNHTNGFIRHGIRVVILHAWYDELMPGMVFRNAILKIRSENREASDNST